MRGRVVVSVVGLVEVLVGGDGTEVVQGVGMLDAGLVIPVEVEAGSVVVVGVDEGTLMDEFKVLVSMEVGLLDVSEYSVLLGLAEDMTARGEDTCVITDSVEVSLGGVAVGVCSAVVLVAGEVALVA